MPSSLGGVSVENLDARRRRTRAPRPHRDVARRFQRLLRVLRLSREEFTRAVDGAIAPRSLFTVLNGTRRPSRALAVLIERTWGFRADYLLHGEGEMWGVRPEAGGGAEPVASSERLPAA